LGSVRTTRKGTRRLSPTPAKIAAGGDTEGANVGDPAGVPSEGEFNLEDRTSGGALLPPREASRNEGAEDEDEAAVEGAVKPDPEVDNTAACSRRQAAMQR